MLLRNFHVVFTAGVVGLFSLVVNAEPECKLLDHMKITYSQDDAPHDMTALMAATNQILNDEVSGVIDMDLNYDGNILKRWPGEYLVSASIRTAEDRHNPQCFQIPLEIKDVDECSVSVDHPMRHRCDPSSVCLNTIGSYECTCKKGFFGMEDSGSFSEKAFLTSALLTGHCFGENTTISCCDTKNVTVRHDVGYACLGTPAEQCSERCKADFKCTNDACAKHKCKKNQECQKDLTGAAKYSCSCKQGYVLENEECISEDELRRKRCQQHTCEGYCKCEIDPDQDGYRCIPVSKQYIAIENPFTNGELPLDHKSHGQAGGYRLDNDICVDKHPPTLNLNCPNPMYMTQGDKYQECGCNVVDKNTESHPRQVKIQYSETFYPYMRRIGNYSVTYSVETPWLKNHKSTEVRTIHVGDVNECAYTGDVEEYRNKCVPGEAECINYGAPGGGYTCRPKEGYGGDGFVNGTGTYDIRKPVVKCVGRGCEPFRFKACSCMGMVSASTGDQVTVEDTISEEVVDRFLNQVKDFCTVRRKQTNTTADHPRIGASSSSSASTSASDNTESGVSGGGMVSGGVGMGYQGCFEAYDLLWDGVVDLTPNIVIGPRERIYDHENEAAAAAARALGDNSAGTIDGNDSVSVGSVPAGSVNAGTGTSGDVQVFRWRIPYTVTDAGGNKAEPAYLYIEVESVNVLDQMRYGSAVGGGKSAAAFFYWYQWWSNLASSIPLPIYYLLLLLCILLAILILIAALSILRKVLLAAKAVCFPYSLVNSREDFETGMDFALSAQSMGMLPEKEKRRKINEKWRALCRDYASNYDDGASSDGDLAEGESDIGDDESVGSR